jgi:uncharacterized protein (UPF0147 family)
MSTTATELTAKQAKVLCALVNGQTIDNAAESAGLTAQTVYRWLRDKTFSDEYRTMRRDVVSQATASLQAACGDAVSTLRTIANDSKAPASSRVSAARAILDTSIKAIEIEDLALRIEALEGALENKTEAKRW